MSALEKVVNGLEIPANFSLVLATAWIIINDFAVWSQSPVIIGKYAESKSSLRDQNRVVGSLLRLTSQSGPIRFALESDLSAVGESNVLKYYGFGENLNNEEYFYRLFVKKDRAIWLIDSLKSFQHLENDLNNERWRYQRNGYFCIIYTGRETNRLQNIQIMFQRLFEIYVLNIIVLISVREMVLVYTYYPFTETNCFNTEPKLFNYFGPITNYSYNKPILFPKKLSNMWRCPLVVTTWTDPPFMIVENDNSTGKFIRLSGIEGMLMMLLSEEMNFTMRIVPPEADGRGSVLPNGTATGAMKMLMERETNITINSYMLDKDRSDIGQPAYSYLSTPLLIGVPKGRTMTPFERIIRPFRQIIWFCLSTSLLLAIFVIYALKFFKSRMQTFTFGQGNRIPFTNLWTVFYGGVIHASLPQRNFARYILIVWILYTFILRSAYLGQLFLILQDSRARSNLNTVDEVIAKNLIFYTYPILVPIIKNTAKTFVDVRLIDSKTYTVQKLFEQISKKEDVNIAVAINGYFIIDYNQNNKKLGYHINIIRESLLIAPLTFYMPKHSYLTDEVNALLLNIMSVGLMDKFEEVYIESDLLLADGPKEPTEISFRLLMGLFSIYLGLLFLSTFVFLLELWSERSPLTRKLIDFFNY